MIVRAIDQNYDWTFGSGKNNYLRDQSAVGQNIATRLRSFLNDCFFDMESGIDWWGLLGTKNRTGLDLAQKMTILNTENVTELLEFSSALSDTRLLSTTYSVSTVYSESEPLTKTTGIF